MNKNLNENLGRIHPITRITNELIEVFYQIGFSPVLGNELEEEYYNFDALNIDKNHPARAMHDTFWIKGEDSLLLRTHTSPMQIRFMEKNEPPFKIIVPGKVFRNEATDKTHECQFHQLEGLVIDENITLADMKSTIDYCLKKIFGENIETRYRANYFPFTEPSLEVDIRKKGNKEWLEMLGCGMVHPMLLSRVGINPKKYQGFAFGLGVDRIALLKYGLSDVRDLYKGDLKMINQF